jgi:hypothetical protein
MLIYRVVPNPRSSMYRWRVKCDLRPQQTVVVQSLNIATEIARLLNQDEGNDDELTHPKRSES